MNTNQDEHDSVLAILRALVPQRTLTYFESFLIAELQANRLLEFFQISGPRVPTELVTELPRIEVRYEHDMPVGGSAHWEHGRWLISLRSWEPRTRQRFSLMHEFKHLLDHPYAPRAYRGIDRDGVERIADHFAACVLMPKRWLKSEWYVGGQNVPYLARRLGVSAQALHVRLWHLGLTAEDDRCRSGARWTRRDDCHVSHGNVAGVAA
jgi:hypothetical protein